MRDLFALVRRVAPTRAAVLIQGERGSGKKWLALALHAVSGRRGPLVSLACDAAPAAFERALFGGEGRGGRRTELGVAEQADGGTLLLEDIDRLRVDLQSKILRLLESHEFRRVGGRRLVRPDLRVVATSCGEIASRIERGEFRPDLYFRLCVFTLRVPPLRERREDLRGLMETAVSDAAMVALESYPWPGNLDELASVVSAAREASGGIEIDLEHLPDRIRAAAGRSVATRLSFRDAKDQLVAQFERAYIGAALEQNGGNVSRAAAASGLHRKSVTRLARKYQVRVRSR